MKRIVLLITVISLLCVSLVGCGGEAVTGNDSSASASGEVSDNNTSATVEESKVEVPDFTVTADNLKTVFYGFNKNDIIAYEKVEEGKVFQGGEFTFDGEPEESYSIEIGGVTYTGTYVATGDISCTDTVIHKYAIDDGYRQIHVDTKTNLPQRLQFAPIDFKFTTEKEYLDYIKEICWMDIDFDEYEYTCTTHYTDNAEATSKEGFYVPDVNDTENLTRYAFKFTKKVNGLDTCEFITVEFMGANTSGTGYPDKMNYEINSLGYTEEQFKPVTDNMELFEENAKKHLTDSVNASCSNVNVEITNKTLFMKDGKPYLRIKFNVTAEVDGGETSASITVITGIK